MLSLRTSALLYRENRSFKPEGNRTGPKACQRLRKVLSLRVARSGARVEPATRLRCEPTAVRVLDAESFRLHAGRTSPLVGRWALAVVNFSPDAAAGRYLLWNWWA
jgi:hypothetical protein